GGDAHVQSADAFASQQFQQSVGFGVGDDKFDRDGQVGRELKKMLLVQDAMTPESGDGAKCRPAMDAGLLRLLEQPFEKRHMMVNAAFVHVKPQYRALHASPPFARPRQPVSPGLDRRGSVIGLMPAPPMRTTREPATCREPSPPLNRRRGSRRRSIPTSIPCAAAR